MDKEDHDDVPSNLGRIRIQKGFEVKVQDHGGKTLKGSVFPGVFTI